MICGAEIERPDRIIFISYIIITISQLLWVKGVFSGFWWLIAPIKTPLWK